MGRIINIEQPLCPFHFPALSIILAKQRIYQNYKDLYYAVYFIDKYEWYDCIQQNPYHHIAHLSIKITPVPVNSYDCKDCNTAPIGGKRAPYQHKNNYAPYPSVDSYIRHITNTETNSGNITLVWLNTPVLNGMGLIPKAKQYAKWEITAKTPSLIIYFFTLCV